jgi:hypothetical protein
MFLCLVGLSHGVVGGEGGRDGGRSDVIWRWLTRKMNARQSGRTPAHGKERARKKFREVGGRSYMMAMSKKGASARGLLLPPLNPAIMYGHRCSDTSTVDRHESSGRRPANDCSGSW